MFDHHDIADNAVPAVGTITPSVVGAGNGRRFQVLALDGGGVRGIFTAALLAGLEEDLGTPIVDHFDLVVGTSTGGIIALALGAGLTPREILDFYVDERHAIFARSPWTSVRRLFRAKYRSDGLEAALRRVFGDRLLGESRLPLVVPSYDLGENAVHLFKTPHHPRLRRDFRVPMWAVGMATTAAPTYFPAFRLPGEEVRLVDGGVWANNPAMVGVTEAVSMFGYALSEIRVLSVGTTTSVAPRSSKLDDAGIVRWGRGTNVVEVLLAGQSVGAFAQVQHLIGAEKAHRLNPPSPPDASLDACDARELVGKAAHHSRVFAPTFDSVFAAHRVAPFQPFHGPLAKAGN
jgi:patatin-like phospholipase/acyl hydrolase